MKGELYLCVLCFIVRSWTSAAQAEESLLDRQQPKSEKTTAVKVLEGYIGQHNPPLEDPNRRMMGILFIGGSVVSLGCAGLALIPTMYDWGPAGEDQSYAANAALGGYLQGFFVNMSVGVSLSTLIFPEIDLRSEYGSLLDLDGEEREERAILILRKISKRARQQRLSSAFFVVAATVLPAGAYYLGEALLGPNPNVKDLGIGYVAGIAGGALTVALLGPPVGDSDAERIDEPFRSTRSLGRNK